MSTFLSAFGAECSRVLRRGNLRSVLVTLAVLAAFGILVPWMKGFDFLDTRFVLAYCSIGLLFAGPLMAEMLAHDGTALAAPIVYFARIPLAALYGWVVSVLMLAMGFVVVNVRHWHGSVLLPATPVLICAITLGLLTAIVVAEFTAVVTLQLSANAARIALRVVFLGVLAFILFGPDSVSDAVSRALANDALPAVAWKISAGLVAISGVLLFALQSTVSPKSGVESDQ